MSDLKDLLVEIGTEELPPQSVRALASALADGIAEGLKREGLSYGIVTSYATPRRLAVLVNELQSAQEERQIERRGPAVSAAFDNEGNPTKAALGFASSCGVEVEHLGRLENKKGEWLAFRTTQLGQSTASLLPEIIERAASNLPVKRRMRWSDGNIEFVRPVHWVVLILGDELVDAKILGISTGRHTRGHRFHQPNAIAIDSPNGYASQLYSSGHVVADYETRKEMILIQVEETAATLGGVAEINAQLLEEVTSLVEWPVPVSGSFDEEFLSLPASVLIATMRGAQKYFHVKDTHGNLLPRFITISNIDSRNPASVRAGNERVIRPRLKDAAFFYETDRQHKLETRLESIKDLKFQAKLGSMYDKSVRVSKLAAYIAIAMGRSPDDVVLARRAGILSKCDLVTAMVGEFPELQGVIGGEYADYSGESDVVAHAIAELYRPRFSGDAIPKSLIGRALSIADKLDTLAGIFGIEQIPTGDKDPYALRRAALGVLRIIIEGEMTLELPKLIEAAAAQYDNLVNNDGLVDRLFDFMMDRLKAYFLDQEIPFNVFSAVMERRPSQPYDFAQRVKAVNNFCLLPEAKNLAAANKRIQNILRQCDETLPNEVNDTLFSEDAEWNLAAKLVGLSSRVKASLNTGDYGQALTLLAGLGEAIDQFFDTVKVMSDDNNQRRNRLALLNNIGILFLATADISQLQS